MKLNEKKFLFFTFAVVGIFFLCKPSLAVADDCDNLPTDNAANISAKIKCLDDKVGQLSSQASTLKNQIAQFDYQIKLTILKISQTQAQIDLLGGRIDQLEISLQDLTKAFSSRAVETYKLSRFENNFFFILSASDINDATQRFHYLQKIEEEDRSLLTRLQEAQITYQGQKQDQETLQKQLKDQQAIVNAQKVAKNNLLIATKNDESKYQSLLAQARAALASLSGYAESVGVSLIPHKDLSDGWGKYFNQRDEQWGNLLVNDDTTDCRGGSCTLARIGCLVTSYAMVVSHFGGSQLPSDVAVNPSNFYSNTADFNSPGPSANGHGVTPVSDPSLQQLRDALNSGKVVIAGLSINGGPAKYHFSDHWVVLRAVDGDSFKINDPVYPDAMNVSLKDHYSSWTIIQAKIYN